MKENKMKQIAEVLGIELGDKIRVKRRNIDSYEDFTFTKHGLFNDNKTNCYSVLVEILCGDAEFEKIWKPKNGDTYFCPYICNERIKHCEFIWNDLASDNFRLQNKLVCKTIEEADEFQKWILEQIKSYIK